MNSETLVKIINTLLSILGIWTAVSVTKMTYRVSTAAETIAAGVVGLPGRTNETTQNVKGEVPASLPPNGRKDP